MESQGDVNKYTSLNFSPPVVYGQMSIDAIARVSGLKNRKRKWNQLVQIFIYKEGANRFFSFSEWKSWKARLFCMQSAHSEKLKVITTYCVHYISFSNIQYVDSHYGFFLSIRSLQEKKYYDTKVTFRAF